MDPARVAYCPACGTRMGTAERGGRLRPACPACGLVYFASPAVGVAVIVEDEQGRVLLGRRARGRHAGLWCIPCGYVEWGEEVEAAAVREFAEETGLLVELTGIEAVKSNFHDPERLTVGIWFRGRVVGGTLRPADGELSELAYVDPATPPQLAFPTDAEVLAELARRMSGQ